jgi:hypothetical protein
MGDSVGMGPAVKLLFYSVSAIPHIKGEKHIQFDSMRKPRGTFSLAWESSPMGIREGSTFSSNMAKITITSCPTQQKWFNLMMRGAESRMGWTSKRQQPLRVRVIGRSLNLIKEEAKDQEQIIAREYYKVGAAVATALCGLLRGSEIFMLELAALHFLFRSVRDTRLCRIILHGLNTPHHSSRGRKRFPPLPLHINNSSAWAEGILTWRPRMLILPLSSSVAWSELSS